MNKPFVSTAGRLSLRGGMTRARVCAVLLAFTLPALSEPATKLAWTKKFGGGYTQIRAMVTDAQGNIYIAGTTTSMDLPANGVYSSPFGYVGAAGGVLLIGAGRATDAFAAKLTPQGDLIWATYLGGSGDDAASSIALDPSGNVYVAGTTHSYDFPVSAGAYNGGFIWHTAGFVTKLAPDGSQVLYSSLLKLFGDLNGLAVDQAGSAYVTGSTRDAIVTTPGVIYPDTGEPSGCPHPLPDGECFPPGPGETPLARAFISKLTPTGSALAYSTYLGDWPTRGGYPNVGQAVAVDRQGNAYAAGSTLWALNPTATQLLYATVVPGYASIQRAAEFDAAVLDQDENLIVGGQSVGTYLYTTPGVWKPWPDGQYDGFLAKYGPNGNLLASTSMGVPVSTIALASDATVIAGGQLAYRSDGGDYGPSGYVGSYYTKSLLQGPFGDCWFARLTADFSHLQFSSFIGKSRMSILRVAGLPGGSLLAAQSENALNAAANDIQFSATSTADSTAPRIDQIVNEANSFRGRWNSTPRSPESQMLVWNGPNCYPSPLSPSERIVIYGAGFGWSGARVLIGGVDAELVNQDGNVLTVVVPNSTDPAAPADVVVEANGLRSTAVPVPMVQRTPALYGANPYPDLQALVLNADGSVNSEANPAARGSLVAVAVNGYGKYSGPGPSIVFEQTPDISINNQYAYGADTVLLPAPGFQGLLTFVKVYVPDTTITGPTPVPVQAGLAVPWPPWIVSSMWIK